MLWKILAPVPIVALISIVTVIPAIILVLYWPVGIGLLLGHVGWVGVAGGRNNSSPSGWDRLETGFVLAGLAFLYDVGIVGAACGLIAVSGFHLNC